MHYDAWSQAYDYIFPLKDQTLAYLKRAFKRGRLCDLGCGSGSYAIALAERGWFVDAYDLSENLIDLARKKSYEGLSVNFNQADIRDFSAEDAYDGIYTIGNTLVHLDSHASVKKVLKSMYNALKPHGIGVIQIINYDRIINHNVKQLPTIEHAPFKMERHYHLNDDKIAFTTILHHQGSTKTNTIDLLPLKKADLITYLKDVGFQEIKCYGGFDHKPFQKDTSIPLIVEFKR